ncbi:SGNH/GDSL hydrolase family protein [Janibacter terrae]|uniref:SGNH/GDSL hydrolase family protein n=1 Tax=Janibacter terrae TaxID=103817 RepID=UPI00082CB8D0|nr:SGNH/GDSL hydrolase family protein [Janibacter terrae]
MADRTTPQGLQVFDSGDPGAVINNGMASADSTDAAIGRVAQTAGEAKAAAVPVASISGDNADTWTSMGSRMAWAVHGVANTPRAGVSWRIDTTVLASSAILQVATAIGLASEQWSRFKGSVSWTAWSRMDQGAAVEALQPQIAAAGSGGSPAGWRRVPLALTVGQGAATQTGTTGGVRLPVHPGVAVSRWRLHATNVNPRFGSPSGTVTVSGVWVGAAGATAGTWASAPTKVSNGSAGASAGEWVSEWISTPIPASSSTLIGAAWSVSGTSTVQQTFAVGHTTTQTDAGNNAAAVTASSSVPLHWWVEAEVPAATPTLAVIGDSIASGVGSTRGVADSWPAIWGRTNGVLVSHYSASGDALSAWGDSTAYKWSMYPGAGRPDAAVLVLGSNDIFGGATLATLQTNAGKVADAAKLVLGAPLHLGTITPRDGVTGAMETVRRDYNTWLRGRPLAARSVSEVSAAVSTDDETLTPAMTSDGIHLTTAGSTAAAGTVSKATVMAPAPTVAAAQVSDATTTGRAVMTATDAAAARTAIGAAEQRDTGWRALTGGTKVQRVGSTVFVQYYGSLPAGTGDIDADTLPVGFRPKWHAAAAYHIGPTSLAKALVLTTGQVRFYGITASGAFVTLTVAYATPDAWPTTLPGTPA